ncbi:MAG: DUF4124 domain-containing protein [Fluviicoccus sp.]|uniref:DUF4124 domain-containing protein n=1 Tax=Fluviicoccus sp. TaxID=2003552 RepID=UPI00271A9F16|nr:DUF4124 domain-containing protein [Fluviicoccus sp.]MDO8332209.1 DUF4124 domain-containing protein [Fluviicoccus sp.]
MTRAGVWLGLLLLPVMAWSGEAYRCTDAAGKISFSDQPCGQSQEGRIYAPAPVTEKRETLSASTDLAPPVDDTTSGTVIERGQHLYDNHHYAEALPLLREAANAGEVRAYTLLGMIYFKGWGTTKDYHESFKWFQLAAQAGEADAQANLGFQYERGLGTRPDSGQARYWYEKAAAKGIRLPNDRQAAMPTPVAREVIPPRPARSPYEGLPPDIRRSMEMGDEARSNLAKAMESVQREQARQAAEHKKSKAGNYGWVLVFVLGVIAVVVLLLSTNRTGTDNRPSQPPQTTGSANTGDVGLYTSRQAGMGTFLGGPLVGIYMLYLNFEAINEPDLAKSTLVIGGVCCLAMVGVLPFLPDRFPGIALPVAYTLSMVRLMKHYQFEKEYIEDSLGYVCQSGGSATGVSLVGFVVLFVVSVAWMMMVS